MATKSGPVTTIREFKSRSLAGLRRANPGEKLTMEWDDARRVTYPTGLKGFHGTGRVIWPDGASRRFLASADKYGISVR